MIYTILSLLFSFLFTLYLLPKWIFRAKKANLTGKDLHKDNKQQIPEVGGLPVVCGFLSGVLIYISFKVFIHQQQYIMYTMFAACTSVLIATIIGFVDDILGWKIGLRQFQKMLLTFGISVPIIVINAGDSTMNFPVLGQIDFGLFYPLLLIPLGIMFTSNAFNMVAGYNGLEAGMGIIILSALSFLAYMNNAPFASVLGLSMVVALIAFLFYNWHPAKIFPGDTMTYSVGALIGIIAVLANIEKFAILLFSLYIIQFFLKLRGKMQKESFAKILPDKSLDLPYSKIYGIEHIAIWIIKKVKKKVYEIEVTLLLLSVQAFIALATLLYFFLQ